MLQQVREHAVSSNSGHKETNSKAGNPSLHCSSGVGQQCGLHPAGPLTVRHTTLLQQGNHLQQAGRDGDVSI